MRKGELTKAAIIEAALDVSASAGLEGLTIGLLADKMAMSKSGVFAHFGSREDLQIAVLKVYEQRFVDEVLVPALNEKRGLPRFSKIVANWLRRTAEEATRGCIWISGASEYDDRPGAVRTELVGMVNSWQKELTRAIVQTVEIGDLPSDTDVSELVFEIYGIVLVLHHDARLMKSPDAFVRAQKAMTRLMNSYSQNLLVTH